MLSIKLERVQLMVINYDGLTGPLRSEYVLSNYCTFLSRLVYCSDRIKVFLIANKLLALDARQRFAGDDPHLQIY